MAWRPSDAQSVETAEALKLHDDLLASRPADARHDSDICPFCLDRASEGTPQRSGALPSSDGPDVSEHTSTDPNTKGGTTDMSDTISKETHDALLAKAVSDALAEQAAALTAVTTERDELASKNTELAEQVTTLTGDNERLNKDLDAAQVTVKAREDEVASLKDSIAETEAAAAKAEIASKRTEQVKALSLFAEDYIGEKASAWAELTDEAWADRLAEWQRLKPATEVASSTNTDTASALSGTSGSITEAPTDAASATKKPARRAVLGLS